jgi:hypothetical protein
LPSNYIRPHYAGVRYKFILTAQGDHDIGISSTTACLTGVVAVSSVTAAECIATACAAQDIISFIGQVALVGDTIEVISDGTQYAVRAFTGVTGGLTVTP